MRKCNLNFNPFRTLWSSSVGLALFLWGAFASAASGQGGCALACNQAVQISLDQTGQATVNAAMIAPYAYMNCPGSLELTVFDPQNNPISSTVTCSRIDQTLPVKVRHFDTGNICYGSVVVKDYLPPIISCIDTFITCTKDTAPSSIGFPAVSDNCTALNASHLAHSDQKTDLPCFTQQNGHTVTARIDRTWSVSDQSGNTTTCVQKIWVKRATLSDVVYPGNLDGFAAPSLDCAVNPNNLAITGQPKVDGIPIASGGDCELVVGHDDQIQQICAPAGYRIFRTWSVTDYCANTFNLHVQILLVEDKTPPVIAMPANITVGTNGANCTGSVTLPNATAVDNCSAYTIVPSWTYGTGYGPFSNVAKGTHVVTYTATDACGNSATATLTVQVIDDDPPAAICKGEFQFSLPATGIGYLVPAAINNGSTDNCSSLSFQVSRDTVIWGSSVQVTCADIGPPVKIWLKVLDGAGLENQCQTTVNVRDNIKPTLVCPPNITLTCQQSHTNLSVTGTATATDICGMQGVTYSDVLSLNNCNIGSVQRTWVATDLHANTSSQVQTITLVNNAALTVTFPANTVLSACGDTSALNPLVTGKPVVSGNVCVPPTVSFTDERLPGAPPYCFQILRKWKVIDWCTFNPNNPSAGGYWEQIQQISVTDGQAPILSVPSDLTVSIGSQNCAATVALLPATAVDCSQNLTFTNNSPYASASGANASGTYPLGVHQIMYSASDGCGNSTIKFTKITVIDAVAPVVTCASGVVVNLVSGGTAPVNATVLAASAIDNCTASAQLTLSCDPAQVTCVDLGSRPITVRAVDAAGNIGTCIAQITVTDDNHVCVPEVYLVGGTIRNELGNPIRETPVRLASDGFLAIDDCDLNGDYLFEDVPGGPTYTLQPKNNEKWLNGVSTLDLLLINRHILGQDTLSTPYKIIAADANHSGSITTYDIVQLRKLILGILDTLPGNTSWRFVVGSHVFANPANPFANDIPESMTLATLHEHRTQLHFVGLKVGDVNNNANLTDTRSPGDTTVLYFPNRAFEAGDPIQTPFKLPHWKALEGFQFELTFDSSYVAIDSIVFPKNKYLTREHVFVKPGKSISCSWDDFKTGLLEPDSAIFTVFWKGLKQGTMSEALSVHRNRIDAEAYVRKGTSRALDIRPEAEPVRRANFVFKPNYPNPFKDKTRFEWLMPEAAEATFTFTDVYGKTVYSQVRLCSKGWNTLDVSGSVFPTPGIYFFHFGSTATPPMGGKIIITD